MIREDRDIGDGRQSRAVTVGEVLAEARHRKGFTVAEVSHYTRVRESIIRAIEQDDCVLSGSEAHARRDIHAIATALGLDPGPLISAFDATYPSAPKPAPVPAIPPAIPPTIPPTIPFGRAGRDGAFARIQPRRIRWVPSLALLVLAGIGFAVYHFVFAGAAHPPPPASRAAASGQATPSGSAVRALAPARVTAFGPHGPADGDNAALARLATDGNPATAWITDGYGSPRFASVQAGTGLLLDMGKAVTITGAEITVGSDPGAAFQMRTGNTPSLADLSPVAIATADSGVLAVRLTAPVHARYVLIWFTTLPQAGSSGIFQARVYNLTILGSSR